MRRRRKNLNSGSRRKTEKVLGTTNTAKGQKAVKQGKNSGNDWYEAQKAQIQKQLTINKTEFKGLDPSSRVRVEGYICVNSPRTRPL